MGIIFIPPAVVEKAAKTALNARVMDTKQLARHLLLNSYAAGTIDQRLTAADAFEVARRFMDEQAKRFPKHETGDGQESAS